MLPGSHRSVARWLHDAGDWGVGNHRRVRTIVEKAIAQVSGLLRHCALRTMHSVP